jgi:ATP-dependent HslUV protease subunit HslV
MTTTVVVKKAGRVCIAADTMSRYGSCQESADFIENSSKLVHVDDAVLAPCGPASANLVLGSYFADPERRRDFSTLEHVFESVRALQVGLKEEYFLNPREDETDPFESLQMELLVASPGGIFGVYPLRSVQEYKRYYSFGSGSEYALGAMHANYERLASAEEIARSAIEAAACFDDATGLPLTMESIVLAAPFAVDVG